MSPIKTDFRSNRSQDQRYEVESEEMQRSGVETGYDADGAILIFSDLAAVQRLVSGEPISPSRPPQRPRHPR